MPRGSQRRYQQQVARTSPESVQKQIDSVNAQLKELSKVKGSARNFNQLDNLRQMATYKLRDLNQKRVGSRGKAELDRQKKQAQANYDSIMAKYRIAEEAKKARDARQGLSRQLQSLTQLQKDVSNYQAGQRKQEQQRLAREATAQRAIDNAIKSGNTNALRKAGWDYRNTQAGSKIFSQFTTKAVNQKLALAKRSSKGSSINRATSNAEILYFGGTQKYFDDLVRWEDQNRKIAKRQSAGLRAGGVKQNFNNSTFSAKPTPKPSTDPLKFFNNPSSNNTMSKDAELRKAIAESQKNYPKAWEGKYNPLVNKSSNTFSNNTQIKRNQMPISPSSKEGKVIESILDQQRITRNVNAEQKKLFQAMTNAPNAQEAWRIREEAMKLNPSVGTFNYYVDNNTGKVTGTSGTLGIAQTTKYNPKTDSFDSTGIASVYRTDSRGNPIELVSPATTFFDDSGNRIGTVKSATAPYNIYEPSSTFFDYPKQPKNNNLLPPTLSQFASNANSGKQSNFLETKPNAINPTSFFGSSNPSKSRNPSGTLDAWQFFQGTQNTLDSYGVTLGNVGNFFTGKPMQEQERKNAVVRPPIQDDFFGAVVDSGKNFFYGDEVRQQEGRAKDPMGDFIKDQSKRPIPVIAGELFVEGALMLIPVGWAGRLIKGGKTLSEVIKGGSSTGGKGKKFFIGKDADGNKYFYAQNQKPKNIVSEQEVSSTTQRTQQGNIDGGSPLGKATIEEPTEFFGKSKNVQSDGINFASDWWKSSNTGTRGGTSTKQGGQKLLQKEKPSAQATSTKNPVADFFKSTSDSIKNNKGNFIKGAGSTGVIASRFFKNTRNPAQDFFKGQGSQQATKQTTSQTSQQAQKLKSSQATNLKSSQKRITKSTQKDDRKSGLIIPFFPTPTSTPPNIPIGLRFFGGGGSGRGRSGLRKGNRINTAWNVNTNKVGSFFKGASFKQSWGDTAFKELDIKTKNAKGTKSKDNIGSFFKETKNARGTKSKDNIGSFFKETKKEKNSRNKGKNAIDDFFNL